MIASELLFIGCYEKERNVQKQVKSALTYFTASGPSQWQEKQGPEQSGDLISTARHVRKQCSTEKGGQSTLQPGEEG